MTVAGKAVNSRADSLNGCIAIAGMEVILVAVEVPAPSSGTSANIGLCFKDRHRLAIAASEGTAGRGNVVGTTVTIALAVSPAVTPPLLRTSVGVTALPATAATRRSFAVVFRSAIIDTSKIGVEVTTGRTSSEGAIAAAVTAIDGNAVLHRTAGRIHATMLVTAATACNTEHILCCSCGIAVLSKTTGAHKTDSDCRSTAARSTKQVAVTVTGNHRSTAVTAAVVAARKRTLNFATGIAAAILPVTVIDRTRTALDEVKLSALLSLKDKADTTAGRCVTVHGTAACTVKHDFIGASIGEGVFTVGVRVAACAFQLIIDLRTGALLIDVEINLVHIRIVGGSIVADIVDCIAPPPFPSGFVEDIAVLGAVCETVGANLTDVIIVARSYLLEQIIPVMTGTVAHRGVDNHGVAAVNGCTTVDGRACREVGLHVPDTVRSDDCEVFVVVDCTAVI